MNAAFFEVGVVTGSVGFRGEIKVYPVTDDPSRFRRLSEIYLETPGGLVSYAIQSVRYQKNLVVLKLANVDDEAAAEKLRGQTLKIPPEQALPLEANQYYHRDLLDMSVIDEDGHILGTLTRIIETGANDVYTITKQDGGELLIPAIKQCVLNVDVTAKRMTIRLMPGLPGVSE